MPTARRFPGGKRFIRGMGNGVLLRPEGNPLQPSIESLSTFRANFMEERHQPLEQERDPAFE